MLESLASLYVGGINPNWKAFEQSYSHRRMALPTYPFQRQRYWLQQEPQSRGKRVDSIWDVVTSAAASQSTQGPLDLHAASYPAKWQVANQIACVYQAQTLRALGVFTQSGERHSLDDVMGKANIKSNYASLLNRWLDTMVESGWLRRDGNAYISDAPLPAQEITALWHELGAPLAEIRPLAEYLRRSGDLLSTVLTGAESPLETLFPGGNYSTVDFLYHDWSLPRYFNNIIAKTVVAAADHQQGKQLRILEIGAGTGGTSATVLPALAKHDVNYIFTDLSEFFLARAQERFVAYPFVRYQRLDIEQNPAEQGFAANDFDVVIAANVLHATSNLDRTLQHVHSLLAPGGLLMLYEASEHPAWFDITVGLIEGWSKFEDQWRGDHPLLNGERWAEALRANGFESVEFWPKADTPAQHLLHSVILAQGPYFEAGVVDVVANELAEITRFTPAETSPSVALRQQFDEALPGDRAELLEEFVRNHLRRALRMTDDHPLGVRERLTDLGFDSLMAVELRSKLSDGLGLTKMLPATFMFDYPTIEAMANFLLTTLAEPKQNATSLEMSAEIVAEMETAETESTQMLMSDELNDMTDTEIEALLMKKLENI